ncbi:TetR family transcriptional regulator [Paenibacillus gansuensis]|uniref:TetR family transcriptional regulator n=1 Tax=Paenibacillus gansuensis TaxID=306542 RepID=A0ABW5PMM3_9BACL
MAGEPEIKNRILLAAKSLFAAQGFDATSVRQICEKAGANPALVSYHFGGKHNMFCALFESYFPGTRLPEIDRLPGNAADKIRLLLTEVVHYRSSDPDMIAILQREITTDSPRIDAIRNHVMPVWMMLRNLLEEGKDKGLFHYESLDNTLFFILGIVLFHRHTRYFQPLFSGERISTEKLAEDTCTFVFRGLGYEKK